VSNGKEYTHYIVLNEVILGDASIVEELNDWVSLAFVRLGIGGPKHSAITPSSKTTRSFPKSQTESTKPYPTQVVKSIHRPFPLRTMDDVYPYVAHRATYITKSQK